MSMLTEVVDIITLEESLSENDQIDEKWGESESESDSDGIEIHPISDGEDDEIVNQGGKAQHGLSPGSDQGRSALSVSGRSALSSGGPSSPRRSATSLFPSYSRSELEEQLLLWRSLAERAVVERQAGVTAALAAADEREREREGERAVADSLSASLAAERAQVDRLERSIAQMQASIERMRSATAAAAADAAARADAVAELQEALSREASERAAAEESKATIIAELEDLTKSLFEESNALVAAEAKARDQAQRERAELADALHLAKMKLGALHLDRDARRLERKATRKASRRNLAGSASRDDSIADAVRRSSHRTDAPSEVSNGGDSAPSTPRGNSTFANLDIISVPSSMPARVPLGRTSSNVSFRRPVSPDSPSSALSADARSSRRRALTATFTVAPMTSAGSDDDGDDEGDDDSGDGDDDCGADDDGGSRGGGRRLAASRSSNASRPSARSALAVRHSVPLSLSRDTYASDTDTDDSYTSDISGFLVTVRQQMRPCVAHLAEVAVGAGVRSSSLAAFRAWLRTATLPGKERQLERAKLDEARRASVDMCLFAFDEFEGAEGWREPEPRARRDAALVSAAKGKRRLAAAVHGNTLCVEPAPAAAVRGVGAVTLLPIDGFNAPGSSPDLTSFHTVEHETARCSLCGRLRQCAWRLRLDDEDAWRPLHEACRRRLVAVCDFESFVRQLTAALESDPSLAEAIADEAAGTPSGEPGTVENLFVQYQAKQLYMHLTRLSI